MTGAGERLESPCRHLPPPFFPEGIPGQVACSFGKGADMGRLCYGPGHKQKPNLKGSETP